jgi:hypothetical protein
VFSATLLLSMLYRACLGKVVAFDQSIDSVPACAPRLNLKEATIEQSNMRMFATIALLQF